MWCGAFLLSVLQSEAMVNANVEVIRVELKYCEACGALRLRATNHDSPYCTRCEKIMAGLSRADRTPVEGSRQ